MLRGRSRPVSLAMDDWRPAHDCSRRDHPSRDRQQQIDLRAEPPRYALAVSAERRDDAISCTYCDPLRYTPGAEV